MAEAIAFGIAQNIVTNLGSRAIQEIGSAACVKKELKKLETTVITIRDVLLHAEDLQQVNPEVKTWLRRIKDVAYEADDIIDDFTIEALKKKWLIQGNIIKLVRNFFTPSNPIIFGFKMAHRIKNIQERMKEIHDDRKFHLESRVETMNRLSNSSRENTHSNVNESEVFGRDDDKKKIIESLLHFDGEEKFSIVSIQGIGGLGKTTLANLVYNDKRVESNFELLLWVCVSQDFDVKKITEKIIKSATNNSCPDLEMQQLQHRLRESLAGKKFLLVLDDVWNEDVIKWDEMKDLLQRGAKGSKLMVTTRSANVASIIRSASTYNLSGLSDDHSWNLFKSKAFKKGQEEKNPNLVKIGREIVEKCRGNPLAIKSVGGLMFLKTLEHEWVQVNNSDVWKEKDILPSLRLNYNNLSSSLKQCFAYFSILPKGCCLEKESAVQEWIALGFIRCYDENQCIEDIGREYIETLKWISFLEEDIGIEYVHLKMHDLVYDLAQSVAGEECFVVQEGRKERIPDGVRRFTVPDRVRHLTVWHKSFPLESLEGIPEKSTLHALHLFTPCHMSNVENICSSFRFLRVLALCLVSNNSNIPTSIGDLRHLRVLQIYSSGSGTTVTLPKSIIKLQRLQILQFWDRCTLKNLPKGIHLLSELKHIILSSASYSHMPSGLGQLTSIQTLSVFVVGKGIGCKLNELNRLKCLRGKLTIQNLENVKSARDSVDTNLKEKSNLEELKLVWNDQEAEAAGSGKIHFDVLETLRPHQNLKSLSMHGYKGECFPGWLMADLPRLTDLVMEEMHGLRFIDVERNNLERGGSHHQHYFPALKELRLSNFYNLESWAKSEEESLAVSLPCLVSLTISGCPKLAFMPLLPSLEKCVLDNCSEKLVHSLTLQQQHQHQQLISSSPSTSSSSGLATPTGTLKLLKIQACDELICLSDQVFQGLTGLLELKITNCVSLTTLSGLPHLRSLQTLKLTKCEKLHMLEGLDGLPSLQTLYIEEIPKLESWAKSEEESLAVILPCLVSLTISGCPKLTFMPLLPSLEKCVLDNCSEKLVHSLALQQQQQQHQQLISSSPSTSSSSGLATPTSTLKHLNIEACDNLICLSDQVFQGLTGLLELEITNCASLTTLSGLQHLTLLKTLRLSNCEKLLTLEVLDGLPSLHYQMSQQLHLFCTQFNIRKCEGLVTLPECVKNLSELTIIGCWNLMTWPIGLLRNNRMSLVELRLSGCASLLSLPEELQHLTSLQNLGICFFFNGFTTLPEWLGNLTSLRILTIGFCPNLGCLPSSMSRLTSLKLLDICDCDKLTPRCQQNIGEDWPYIAHIPQIKVHTLLTQ